MTNPIISTKKARNLRTGIFIARDVLRDTETQDTAFRISYTIFNPTQRAAYLRLVIKAGLPFYDEWIEQREAAGPTDGRKSVYYLDEI